MIEEKDLVHIAKVSEDTFIALKLSDQVKKLWGVDKNISFAKKTNADKWI